MEYWNRERLGRQERKRRDDSENSYRNLHHLHRHQLVLASAVLTVAVEGSLAWIVDVEMVEMEVGGGHECLAGY